MQTTQVRRNAFMGGSGDKYEETVYERYWNSVETVVETVVDTVVKTVVEKVVETVVETVVDTVVENSSGQQ